MGYFFQQYLAAPIVIALYVFWKVYSRNKGGFFVRARDMDLMTGMRSFDLDPLEVAAPKKSAANLPKRMLRSLF